MSEKYLLPRNISKNLHVKLIDFITHYSKEGLSEKTSYIYYQFILESYRSSQQERYSISMLATELQKNNIKVSLLINIYYHALNCLALNNGLSIYGEGFIV
jgi:hypothetical protein